MNERIKELAQEHERIWNLYSIGPVQQAEVEDFVEAIVQECLRVAREELVEDDVLYTQADPLFREYLKGNNGGITDAVRAIKQHFGTNNEISNQKDY